MGVPQNRWFRTEHRIEMDDYDTMTYNESLSCTFIYFFWNLRLKSVYHLRQVVGVIQDAARDLEHLRTNSLLGFLPELQNYTELEAMAAIAMLKP